MTNSSTQPNFSGPHKELLTELAGLIDWLWNEHGMSFVKAGDDKVYAFGGNGYIIVLDESKWQGLIEFITPKGTLTLKPGDDGAISITSSQDEKSVKQILRDGINGLKEYYSKRYWSTPKAS